LKRNKTKATYRIPEWDKFKPGDVVEMKGAFFMIHRINPLAKQIILVGIQDPTVLTDNKKNGGKA